MRNKANLFTYVLTTSELFIPLCRYDHFPSACRTFFTISCPPGLLVMNSFSFCMSQKSLFCLQFLKTVLLLQYFRLAHFFSFSWLKMLPCCFWACIFFFLNICSHSILFLWTQHAPLSQATFTIFYLLLIASNLIMICLSIGFFMFLVLEIY